MRETTDVYRELQRQLDRLPVPYPETESGVEIRILKRLFTPEEARAALWVSAFPEPIGTICRRAKGELSTEDLAATLERMARKGIIRKTQGKRGPLYGKSPLVLGMYEAQVDRLTTEFERDVRAYFEERFTGELLSPRLTQQMRTVPVNESIKLQYPVASHDDIRKYVESAEGPFAAIHCVCRQGRDLTGEPCKQTQERRNCLLIGAFASATLDAGIARALSRDEMLGMLAQADREGLVLQPQNTQSPLFVCCCCGCCCGVLTSAKKLERPAESFQIDYAAEVRAEYCEQCGTCVARCQMDAIVASDGIPRIMEERCIGCGLCVTTCPTAAMTLRRLEGRKPVPADMQALYSAMYQDRFGRAGAAVALAQHLLGRRV